MQDRGQSSCRGHVLCTVVVSLWDTVRHISLPVGNAVVGLIVGATVGVVVGLNVGATVGVPGDTHDVGA